MTHDLWTLTTQTAACGWVCIHLGLSAVCAWMIQSKFIQKETRRIFECVDSMTTQTCDEARPQMTGLSDRWMTGGNRERLSNFNNKHN